MSVRSSGVKRFVKRWSRRIITGGGSFFGYLRGKEFTSGVRILTYHRIIEDRVDPFAVPRNDFEKQMISVAQTGFVRPLEEALCDLEGSRASEGPRIALSFDDGTYDFASTAAPILAGLKLPATIYVCPLNVGSSGFLGWNDLRDLSAAGFQVGSHGLEHQGLASLSAEEMRRQVVKSREMLEDRLGHAISSLAYPYGTKRDFNETVKAAVRSAGYRNACTSINGVNRHGVDLMELRRTKIEQGDAPIFREILRGGLDGWAFVDVHLSIFQGRYG